MATLAADQDRMNKMKNRILDSDAAAACSFFIQSILLILSLPCPRAFTNYSTIFRTPSASCRSVQRRAADCLRVKQTSIAARPMINWPGESMKSPAGFGV